MFQTIISNIQGKIKDVVNRAPALFCKLNGTPCATRSPLYDAITKPEWFTLYTIFYWVMAIAICLIICLDVEDRGYYVFVAIAIISYVLSYSTGRVRCGKCRKMVNQKDSCSRILGSAQMAAIPQTYILCGKVKSGLYHLMTLRSKGMWHNTSGLI